MAKEYVKPQIIFEDFSLNTNIAADCSKIVNNASEYSCPYVDRSGYHIFTTELSTICDITQADGEGICYHVPTDSNDLFNS